jgi:hypothetical protein
MNWLCKLIGHKHIGWNCCTVWYHPYYCLRCNADKLTIPGDGCLRCEIFGHHHQAVIIGDYDSQLHHTTWCQRCHAMPEQYFDTVAKAMINARL